ncbi:MAG: hypothetical protein ACLTAI_14095 [Thomasclavelia sp.]
MWYKQICWLKHFPIAEDICQNVKYTINLANRQNILFVIHDWSNIGENVGGTTLHCIDLISSYRVTRIQHPCLSTRGKFI